MNTLSQPQFPGAGWTVATKLSEWRPCLLAAQCQSGIRQQRRGHICGDPSGYWEVASVFTVRQETEALRWWLVARRHTGQGHGLAWSALSGALGSVPRLSFSGSILSSRFQLLRCIQPFFFPRPQSSWGMGSIHAALGENAPVPGAKGCLPGEGAKVTVWGNCPHPETGNLYWEAGSQSGGKI